MVGKAVSHDKFSAVAIIADALTIFAGFMFATWIRFESAWLAVPRGRPQDVYQTYGMGAAVATLLVVFIFQSLDLYVRPQVGTYGSKIPRLIRAIGWGVILTMALAFSLRTEPPFSRMVVAFSFPTITILIILERFLLFRLEFNMARQSPARNRVAILGTDSTAAHIKRALENEPRLLSTVVAFMHIDDSEPDPEIPVDMIQGTMDNLQHILETENIDQLILTRSNLDHQKIIEIILLCDRSLVTFNLVPDLFRILTGNMDVHTIDDIPLLGVGRWPLDNSLNRIRKRAADAVGAFFGLILASPIILIAAFFIRKSSPGPVFFRQERCGENGEPFILYKLRTMSVDAEKETGPVWAVEDDPRRTKTGAFLRRYNLDELPQLWNVLLGHMSLVGPRPERPHFVDQFKEDIRGYMWRHVSKPGLTGWAQVNGLRGNTSIEERIKYDLYYLENWSLAFDFKILFRTLFARTNAY